MPPDKNNSFCQQLAAEAASIWRNTALVYHLWYCLCSNSEPFLRHKARGVGAWSILNARVKFMPGFAKNTNTKTLCTSSADKLLLLFFFLHNGSGERSRSESPPIYECSIYHINRQEDYSCLQSPLRRTWTEYTAVHLEKAAPGTRLSWTVWILFSSCYTEMPVMHLGWGCCREEYWYSESRSFPISPFGYIFHIFLKEHSLISNEEKQPEKELIALRK